MSVMLSQSHTVTRWRAGTRSASDTVERLLRDHFPRELWISLRVIYALFLREATTRY